MKKYEIYSIEEILSIIINDSVVWSLSSAYIKIKHFPANIKKQWKQLYQEKAAIWHMAAAANEKQQYAEMKWRGRENQCQWKSLKQ